MDTKQQREPHAMYKNYFLVKGGEENKVNLP